MEKEKAIYEPGELDKVRGKLGVMDPEEAKRMAKILGGKVGVERSVDQEAARNRGSSSTGKGGRGGPSSAPRSGGIETRRQERTPPKPARVQKADTGDDPSVLLRAPYRERVKMDRYAGEVEFEIKSPSQVFFSGIASLFGSFPDYVSRFFVTKRMNEYYDRLETLVTSTRILLPRNNLARGERFKRTSPLGFSIIDTIRAINIEKISSDLKKIQARPRKVTIFEFSEILRAIYRPLYILELLNPEGHIEGAYHLLLRLLTVEAPDKSSEYQDHLTKAIGAFVIYRKEVQYLLYPLLMKILSNRCFSYEDFFTQRRQRFLAFINAQESDRLGPSPLIPPQPADKEEEEKPSNADSADQKDKQEKQTLQDAEQKMVNKGLQTLEALFPKAGWNKLSEFPDLYPYFADVFGLRKSYVLVAPSDPILQVVILMRILEELFYGIRYISFGSTAGIADTEGNADQMEKDMGTLSSNWHSYLEYGFEKEYLSRLEEYCNILENTAESRSSPYAKRLLNELYWIKRLSFLPYYKNSALGASAFQRRDLNVVYPEIRQLRKYLSIVASGIEKGNKRGGAEKKVPCTGINNPWDAYVFQVSNPLSLRLNSLLPARSRNNASLVLFTLAVVTVLDYLVNNANSWAYTSQPGSPFRSINDEETIPMFGVDTKIDAAALFKQSLKNREQKAAGNGT